MPSSLKFGLSDSANRKIGSKKYENGILKWSQVDFLNIFRSGSEQFSLKWTIIVCEGKHFIIGYGCACK